MKLLNYILLVVLSLASLATHAAGCTNNINTQNFYLNYNAITVQRDVPAGTVVATQTGTYQVNITCPDSTNTYHEVMYNTSLGSSLYDIGITGYGVRVSENDSAGNFHHYFPLDFALGSYSATYMYKAEIVRTSGTAVSGTIRTGKIADLSMLNQFYIANWNISGGTITTLACSINSGPLTFPIGNIPTVNFGSTVGTIPTNAQVTQNLGLTCDAGANINVSLSGTQNPDVADTSVLSLSGQGGAGVAKGVGVQILYNNVPLQLNNKVTLKQSSGGVETFPLVARYYQTKTTVAPGTANATATLNITYQ